MLRHERRSNGNLLGVHICGTEPAIRVASRFLRARVHDHRWLARELYLRQRHAATNHPAAKSTAQLWRMLGELLTDEEKAAE
jgi:hypothetical protein